MSAPLIQFNVPVPEHEDTDQPWNRQPFDHTEDRWAAFRSYLMQPHPRSVHRAAQSAGVSASTATSWSTSCYWSVRVKAFDLAVQGQWLSKVQEVVEVNAENFASQHTKILAMGTELAMREVSKYVAASKEGNVIGLVSMGELNRLIENMVKLGRLTAGESTENVEHTLDFTKLSIAEAKQYKALNKKAEVK